MSVQYSEGFQCTGDIMSTVGDIMSTLGCSVHWGDIMSTLEDIMINVGEGHWENN